MADDQLQREEVQLRAAIGNVLNEALRTHMLAALDAFDPSSSSIQSTPAANATQSESGKNDAIVTKLREKSVTVQKPRDALFVAIHALLLEAGYKLSVGESSEFALPENWDATSVNGLFNAAYVHPNDDSVKFSLQGLFVGGKFEVYISDDKDHTHSIELSVDKFITSGESTAPVSAAGLLQNLKALREKFTPFVESIRPAKKKEAVPVVSSPGFVRPPDRDDRGYGVPSPAFIPPVGGGDAFPPSFGGGNPDMLVGPDHPLFGHRGDPSVGPVPGARFDPFGPSIGPLGPSGIRPPPRGPAPTLPFGGPGPDHMRMPRDDDMDPGFGFGGRGSRGGGGFSQPFGSDNAFF
ncbi:Fbxo7/PI31 domain [Phytophthora cinnamomi]|uniref:Fbxo7/PI31 domain n=1 Tax=Phytophthora cinnamomi TaxID=4785 RepID=UPI0035599A81|nr:Fbxo7/PI31 domain [Phytophthora cinnamomi]